MLNKLLGRVNISSSPNPAVGFKRAVAAQGKSLSCHLILPNRWLVALCSLGSALASTPACLPQDVFPGLHEGVLQAGDLQSDP